MRFQGIGRGIYITVLAAVLSMAPPAALSRDCCQGPPAPNFQRVSHALQRGGQPTDAGLKQLAASGVKSVIDLRLPGPAAMHERDQARKLGLNYFHIPMGYLQPSAATIAGFLQVVTNPSYQPVFVHCRQGADRTGTLIGIYRILVQGWSFDDTYAEMRQHHFKPWLITLKMSVESFSQSISAGDANPAVHLLTAKGAIDRALAPDRGRLVAGSRVAPGL